MMICKNSYLGSTINYGLTILNQGQLQEWTEQSTLIFENLKPVEISKIFLTSLENL